MIRNSRLAALLLAATLLSCTSLFAAGREIDPGTRGGTPYQIRNVSVASNGSGFLTTWLIETYRGGMHTWGTSANAQGRLDSPPRPLIPYGRPKALRSAGDGERYQFDWGDDFGSYRSLLSRTGELQTTTRISYNAPAPSPRVDLIPGGYGSPSLSLRRFDQNGALIAPGNIVLVPSAPNLRILSSSSLSLGDKTLVLWSSGIDSFPNGFLKLNDQHLTSVLVEADGTISHRSDLPIGDGPDLGVVKLVRKGETIVAFFTAGRLPFHETPPAVRVMALRIDGEGKPVDGTPSTVVSGRGLIDAAVNDAVLYLVTSEASPLFFQLWSYALTLDATGFHASPPDFLSPMPADQDAPSIASDGVNFLSVWSEKAGLSQTVRFALSRPDRSLIASGNLMQVQGILGEHAVTFGGGHYLVIWQHFRQLYMQRVSIAGVPLDPAPVQFPEGIAGGSSLTAASDGQKFLIAWDGIRGVLVGADNSVLDLGLLSPPRSSPQAPQPAFPALAWDGSHSNYVLAYDFIHPNGGDIIGVLNADAVAVRIDRDGTRLDKKESLLIAGGVKPVIASNGNSLLVVATGDAGIIGSIVTQTATGLLPGPRVQLAPLGLAKVFVASVAATSSGYLISWRNQGFSDWTLGPIPWFLGARRIAADGTLGSLRAIETGPPDLETPAYAAGNTLGDDLIEISEIHTPGTSPRVTAYTPEELPIVGIPSVPVSVTITEGPTGVIVNWTPATGEIARGFIIAVESRATHGTLGLFQAGAEAHSIVLPRSLGTVATISARVRSWNGVGFSPFSSEAIAVTPRRRTVR